MKRLLVIGLCSFGLTAAFPALTANKSAWSREGRTVLVKTRGQGRELQVLYTRRANERNVLPELESCVRVGRRAYITVSCAVFQNTRTLSLVGDQDFHLCYLYLAVRWPNGYFEVQDNPALQLAKLCGGAVTIPP